MALTKREGSKFWYIQFQYNSRTYVKSSKTTDKKIAEGMEARWRSQLIEQSQLGIRSPIEIDKAFQLFAKSKVDIVSHKYTTRWCNRIAAYFSHLTHLHQIQTKDVEAFRLECVTQGYANQTIKHGLNQISGAVRYAKKLGYQVPELEIPTVKLPRGRLRYLTFDEEKSLLAAVDPRREVKWMASYNERRPALREQMQDVYDLIILFLDTGARHSEITTLTWERIDFENRTINLWRPKVRNESILFMTSRVYEVLSRRKQTSQSVFLFTSKDGSARRSLTHVFQRAFKRAGLEGCSAHTLRHTHATRLIQNGLNLYEVKELLGHAQLQTTMRYAHIEQEHVTQKARDVIESLNLKNGCQSPQNAMVSPHRLASNPDKYS